MKRLIGRFFAPSKRLDASTVVKSWEARRIPFNIIIGLYGFGCLLTFYWAIETNEQLPPGDDAVEPIAIFVAPIVINAMYALGSIVEVGMRRVVPGLSPRFGPGLLKAGLILSFVVISLAAVYWTGYRAMQLPRLID